MCYTPTYLKNALVLALSDSARDQLQLTQMKQGAVLMEAGEMPRHVYFPVGCIVSLLHAMQDGATAEVAVVGHEGMIGLEVFLSGECAPARAVVHSAGPAYRLRADRFRSELDHNLRALYAMLRYTQAMVIQTAQTAACNRHHKVDLQLCRWLLLSLDRSLTNRVHMTQELIANMLGVRRECVTEAACKLQRQGVIAYSRGTIEILDRERLEALSCECYDVIRKASERASQPVLDTGLRNAAPRVPVADYASLRLSA